MTVLSSFFPRVAVLSTEFAFARTKDPTGMALHLIQKLVPKDQLMRSSVEGREFQAIDPCSTIH